MLTIAIQAGGQSRRMQRDKGLVPLNGRPLIEHLLERVRPLGDEILITTNQPQDYAYLGLPMAADETPGAGALAGLHTALKAANGERVLVLACDMPFVNVSLLKYLLELSVEVDIVVPRWQEILQTLHAVYRPSACLPAIEQVLEQGLKRVISFYPQVKVREISQDDVARFDPQGLSFFNVNTPEELQEAEQMIKTQNPGAPEI
ncbi:MAG: molybdenum cofactor guanylyltransferase [Anaerolineales bacterium]